MSNEALSSHEIRKPEAYFAILIFVFIFVFCCIRIFYGISIADEALYSALAYLPKIGGEWFVNDKTVQTTSAILVAPFVAIYTSFFGTSSIMLFTRFLYLAVSLFTALTSFYFFKDFLRWTVSLVLSSVLLAFVPHGMSCLNYNSMGSQFFGLASLFALLAIQKKRPLFAFWSGVFWVLCVFSYPSMLAIFVLSLSIIFLKYKNMSHFYRIFARPFFIGLAIPGGVLLGLLVYLGIGNIVSAIEYSNNFNYPGALWKLPYAFKMIWIYLPPVWSVISILGLWIVLAYLRPQFSILGYLLFLAAFFIFGGLYETQPTTVLWPVIQLFIFIPLIFERKTLSENEFGLIWIIIFPAILGSLVTCLTSRMSLYNMYITGLFGALATTVIIIKRNCLWGWLISLVLSGGSVYWYYHYVYEDAELSTLQYTISEGPFRHLRTINEKGSLIENLQKDLKSLPPQGTILFKDWFPAGYLMSTHQPIGPTINILPAFIHPEARPIYWSIYQDKSNFPDFVIELRFYPLSPSTQWIYMLPDQNPYQDIFYDFFMKSGEYRVLLDRGIYRFLERTKK